MRPEGSVALRRTLRLLAPVLEDAWAELREDWRSHALTLAGIVWGAAAVVLLLALGTGFNRFLDFGVEKTGDRWISVDNQYATSESGGARPGRPVVFTLDDLERIRAGVPSAAAVAGEFQDGLVAAETPRRTRATVVSAAEPELARIQNHRVARGRYLEADDEHLGRRVAVLGANLPEIFFGEAEPLGHTIQLAGEPYRVVGVLARKGLQFFTNWDLHDNMVFVPLRAGQRSFGRGDEVDHILVNPRRRDEVEAVRREVRAALYPFHHLDPSDLEAVRFDAIPDFMEPIDNVGWALQVLLGFVGSVTLAMGGVGVANLMIALVNRRRRELAVRRACGARRSDLTLQLLAESVVVVVAAGGLGVALGAGAALALGLAPLPPDFPPPQISAGVLVTTFAVLVGIGLAAGVAPGRIASRVDPAAALRAV